MKARNLKRELPTIAFRLSSSGHLAIALATKGALAGASAGRVVCREGDRGLGRARRAGVGARDRRRQRRRDPGGACLLRLRDGDSDSLPGLQCCWMRTPTSAGRSPRCAGRPAAGGPRRGHDPLGRRAAGPRSGALVGPGVSVRFMPRTLRFPRALIVAAEHDPA